MAVHHLKTDPKFFKSVESGKKTFECRLNDRNYKVGDLLVLEDYNKEKDEYSGKALSRRVTYVLSDFIGLQPGYVILAMEKA